MPQIRMLENVWQGSTLLAAGSDVTVTTELADQLVGAGKARDTTGYKSALVDQTMTDDVQRAKAASVVGAAYGGVVLAQMSGSAAALSIIASPAGVGSGFNPVYLELFDFANSGVKVGDQVVITLDWNFPLAATTDRTIQWGIGVNTAGYSSVRSRTPPTGQTRIKMVVTINVVSATFARTSTDMYADAASPYRVYNDVNTLNIDTQKVYVRAYVGDTAHAANDSIYLWDASVVRYPRRPA